MPIDQNPKSSTEQKPKKKAVPPGPTIKVVAFVALMKRLEADKEHLTDEQVRFIQNAVQRFEHETDGMVKTKHALPKPKKPKAGRSGKLRIHVMDIRQPTPVSKGFLERLVHLPSEEEALLEIQHLSAKDAERLASEQGLRASSPEIARQKLAETVVTLREIERIAGAGKPQT